MLISAALSLASLGAKAVSGISNVIRMNKEKKRLHRESDSLDDWYKAESNQDYLNTDQSQAVLAKLRETLAKKSQTDANTSEIMGGTVESQIASNEADNQAIADTMTGLSGQATAHKEGIRKDYQTQKSALDEKIAAVNKSQIQSVVNAGQNAMGAFSSANSANKMDAFGNQKVGDIFKDLFKKKAETPATDGQYHLTAPKAEPIKW